MLPGLVRALRSLNRALAMAVVCGVVLAIAAVISPIAWTASKLDLASAPSDGPAKHMLPPADRFKPGVRALPLIDPDGLVAETFPDGKGLDDPDLVDSTIKALAGSVGLGDVIAELLVTTYVNPEDGSPFGQHKEYPYDYRAIDALVNQGLSETEVRTYPQGILDLASLLTIDAARSTRDGSFNSHAAVGYSVLRRAGGIQNTCEIQLNLTFIVSMGFAPSAGVISREAERAAALCEGDPTPWWILGQAQIVQSTLVPDFVVYDRGPKGMAELADQTFARLRRDFPRSPLGWAGAADLRLMLADQAEGLGAQSFEVRARRTQALRFYEEARTVSADPGLLAGYGRALSGLGRHDEAIDVLEELNTIAPYDPAYNVLAIQALTRAGRHKDVVRFIDDSGEPLIPGGLRLSPRMFVPSERPEPISFAFGFQSSRTGHVLDASLQATAGASSSDLGFMPLSNGTWTSTWCRTGSLLASLVMTEDADRAANLVSEGADPASFARGVDCHLAPTSESETDLYFSEQLSLPSLRLVAALESGDDAARTAALALVQDEYTSHADAVSTAQDKRQDFWRFFGRFDKALEAVDDWVEETPDDPWAQRRRGEILFLRGNFRSAVTAFSDANQLFDNAIDRAEDRSGHSFDGYGDSAALGRIANRLQWAAALEYAGRVALARTTYGQVIDEADSKAVESDRPERFVFYAHSQLGTLALNSDKYDEAVTQLRIAAGSVYRGETPPTEEDDVDPLSLLKGAQDNNLALALSKLGRHEEAVTSARTALAYDRGNPIFIDTLAFAKHLAGDDAEATRTYATALDHDSSSYVSANNLAVLLAQNGKKAAAIELLERAIAAKRDYAVAWHNLGVLHSSSTGAFLASQGAFGRAGRLDHALRGVEGQLRVDDRIYESGLDVSKPLSPAWNYSDTAGDSRSLFTWTMGLLLLARMAWILGLDRFRGAVSELVIASSSREVAGPRWFWRRFGSSWAVAAAIAVLAVPLLFAVHSVLEVLMVVLVVSALVLLPLMLRSVVAAPPAGKVAHFGWTPAAAVGLAGMPFGVTFAPFPCLDGEAGNRSRIVRWIAPVTIAVSAGVFIVLTAFAPIPLVRTMATTAIALLASVLTPVPPLDGAEVQGKTANLAITAALALATVAFALKWI